MTQPTLINLPPPPSDPATPSEMGPGTPGSDTTQMSELSTVAIKDGHRGHPHHHHAPDLRHFHGSNHIEAERADRISRLAGLERIAAVRHASSSSIPPGASAADPGGYFDSAIPPQGSHLAKEMSTVGSASATASVGDRTTSDQFEHMDDMDTSSNGGFSDEGNASLVGLGEGASSTLSGPVSSVSTMQTDRTPTRYQTRSGNGSQGRETVHQNTSRSSGFPSRDPNVDQDMTYDTGVHDTTAAASHAQE